MATVLSFKCFLLLFNAEFPWAHNAKLTLRPDFTLNLVHELAFETPKFYIAPYGKINHGVVNLSYNCDMKSGLRPISRHS